MECNDINIGKAVNSSKMCGGMKKVFENGQEEMIDKKCIKKS